MSFDRESRMWAPLLTVCTAAVLLFPAMSLAQAAPGSLEAEVEYIDALSSNGYPDFTEEVIRAALAKWPNAGGVIKAAQIRAQLSGGQQDAVAAEIKKMPNQNSLETGLMKMELARSYYAYGKFSEADALYKDFFNRFKDAKTVPEAARKSYVNAALTYIQMLGKIDRAKEVLPIYKLAMTLAPDEEVHNFIRADYLKALLAQAELAQGKDREALLKDAEGLTSKMIWLQDGYFGDALNGMAHIRMLRGDVKGAQEIIKDNLDMLKALHDSYKETDPDGSKGVLRMSPLPQCRYLIASMLYKAAQDEMAKDAPDEEKIKSLFLGERDPQTKKRNGQGALNHVVNVYTNYPESQSAAAAGEMMTDIVKIIKDRYDTEVKFSTTPEQDAKVRQAQYVEADVKFDSGDWKGAVEAYSKVISRYGLNLDALPRLEKMVKAIVNAGTKEGIIDPVSKLEAETVALTVAEGLSGVRDEKLNVEAGNAVSRIADYFGEVKLKDLQRTVNGAFARYYPKHPSAAARMLAMTEELAKSDVAADVDAAIRAYEDIVANFTTPAQFDVRTKALSELVSVYAPNGGRPDVEKELATAQAFVEHFAAVKQPGINAAFAQNCLGAAYQHAGDAARKAKDTKTATSYYAQAVKVYAALYAELSKPENKYATTTKEKEDAKSFLLVALVQQGLCLQRIPATGNAKVDAAFATKARGCYEELLKRDPKGKYAPFSLLQIGTIQSAQDDVAGARKTLDQLRKDFPDSTEAKNAIPMLADALVSSGRMRQAADVYKEMFDNPDAYNQAQYQAAAQALLEAEQYELAVRAADMVIKGKVKGYLPTGMMLRTRALSMLAKTANAPAKAAEYATDAYLQLEALLAQYGKTTYAIEAQTLLVTDVADVVIRGIPISEPLRVAVIFKGGEKDARPTDDQSARNALINEVKVAVKFVTAQKKDDLATEARLNLAVAQIAQAGFEAARNNQADAEILRAAAGSALNAYTVAMTSGRKINPAFQALSEEARATTTIPMQVIDEGASDYVQDAYLAYLQLADERAKLSETDEDKKAYYGDIVHYGKEYLGLALPGQPKHTRQVQNLVAIAEQND